MKKLSFAIILFCAGSIHDPAPSPAPTPIKWIDVATHHDTVITNASGNSYIPYYAIKNWQSFPDSNAAQGYRQIVGASKDSILVVLADVPNKYFGPYNFTFNASGDTLRSQNFLDTVKAHITPSRSYVKLP